MPTIDPRVDAYIENAAPFARPILTRIRAIVHKACPEVVETIKWSFPNFDHHGVFCSMAAFKQHATFGFWKAALLTEHLPAIDQEAMGHFGRITSVDDLPGDRALVRLVKAAALLNERGVKVVRVRKTPKLPLRPPSDLTAALKADARARAAFAALRPSHRREYVEWIVEARQAATRQKRIATAVRWIAEGKGLNWRYEGKRSGAGSGA